MKYSDEMTKTRTGIISPLSTVSSLSNDFLNIERLGEKSNADRRRKDYGSSSMYSGKMDPIATRSFTSPRHSRASMIDDQTGGSVYHTFFNYDNNEPVYSNRSLSEENADWNLVGNKSQSQGDNYWSSCFTSIVSKLRCDQLCSAPFPSTGKIRLRSNFYPLQKNIGNIYPPQEMNAYHQLSEEKNEIDVQHQPMKRRKKKTFLSSPVSDETLVTKNLAWRIDEDDYSTICTVEEPILFDSSNIIHKHSFMNEIGGSETIHLERSHSTEVKYHIPVSGRSLGPELAIIAHDITSQSSSVSRKTVQNMRNDSSSSHSLHITKDSIITPGDEFSEEEKMKKTIHPSTFVEELSIFPRDKQLRPDLDNSRSPTTRAIKKSLSSSKYPLTLPQSATSYIIDSEGKERYNGYLRINGNSSISTSQISETNYRGIPKAPNHGVTHTAKRQANCTPVSPSTCSSRSLTGSGPFLISKSSIDIGPEATTLKYQHFEEPVTTGVAPSKVSLSTMPIFSCQFQDPIHMFDMARRNFKKHYSPGIKDETDRNLNIEATSSSLEYGDLDGKRTGFIDNEVGDNVEVCFRNPGSTLLEVQNDRGVILILTEPNKATSLSSNRINRSETINDSCNTNSTPLLHGESNTVGTTSTYSTSTSSNNITEYCDIQIALADKGVALTIVPKRLNGRPYKEKTYLVSSFNNGAVNGGVPLGFKESIVPPHTRTHQDHAQTTDLGNVSFCDESLKANEKDKNTKKMLPWTRKKKKVKSTMRVKKKKETRR